VNANKKGDAASSTNAAVTDAEAAGASPGGRSTRGVRVDYKSMAKTGA
jgi:hypothetical protein